jgi:hypothetical protein
MFFLTLVVFYKQTLQQKSARTCALLYHTPSDILWGFPDVLKDMAVTEWIAVTANLGGQMYSYLAC